MIKSFSVTISLILMLIILSANSACSCNGDTTGSKIHPSKYYPRWLMNDAYHTNQTSGITFLHESDDRSMQFFLADDIGKIHRLLISNDTLFSFSEIKFSKELADYFADYPKLDFEEIFYDKFSGNVYLTIEGNGDDYLKYHGIFMLKFKDNNIYQDSVIGIEKLNFKPQEIFNENLRPNIGYEGFTADENFFYLGLENVRTDDGNFGNRTLIRIAKKKSLDIFKEISTENLVIATICGLYSDDNYSLWGIDRNNKRVFNLKFDEYFNITGINYFDIKTVIPWYNNLEYIGSLESITVAANKFLFMVDDPWQAYFIPPNEILNQIDESARQNFRNLIPIIYKFKIE